MLIWNQIDGDPRPRPSRRVPRFSRSLREVGGWPNCGTITTEAARRGAFFDGWTDEFPFLVTKLSPYYDR
jgi:hypothetical protein